MGHLMIWKAGEVIWRVQWGQETCFGVIGGRWGGPGGPRGSRGAFRGSHGAIRLVWWFFRWFMRHISLYICDPNFSCGRTDGLTNGGIPWGPRGPKNANIIDEGKTDSGPLCVLLPKHGDNKRATIMRLRLNPRHQWKNIHYVLLLVCLRSKQVKAVKMILLSTFYILCISSWPPN